METLTQADLMQFSGTEQHYQHSMSNLLFTDGVHYVAENGGAYWLIDAVASYHRTEPFQVWELVKHPDNSATLTMVEDTGQPVKVRQEIPFTDFPMDGIKLYLINGVLLLPSEY